jgi:hypothetical protein
MFATEAYKASAMLVILLLIVLYTCTVVPYIEIRIDY